MAAAMLNGDENTTGFLTSGGTESVLMAVKTYRDRARKLFPHIKEPNIVSEKNLYTVLNLIRSSRSSLESFFPLEGGGTVVEFSVLTRMMAT